MEIVVPECCVTHRRFVHHSISGAHVRRLCAVLWPHEPIYQIHVFILFLYGERRHHSIFVGHLLHCNTFRIEWNSWNRFQQLNSILAPFFWNQRAKRNARNGLIHFIISGHSAQFATNTHCHRFNAPWPLWNERVTLFLSICCSVV